jgi:hypothetical protein
VDPFATDIAGQFSFTFDSGVVSAASGGSEDIALNAVVGGAYFGGVDADGSDGFDQILWTFPHLILAFGADWSSTGENGGVLGIAGNFDGGGEIVFRPVDALGGDGTGFFGIVGSVPISSVRLILSPIIAGTTNNESFFADNLSFPSASASVPEPASLALIGLGFAGLAAARRRKLNYSTRAMRPRPRPRGGVCVSARASPGKFRHIALNVEAA